MPAPKIMFHGFAAMGGQPAALHGMTVHGQWTISTGGTIMYTTACVTVQLD